MSRGEVTLELPGQVRIVVPDDLDVTTTYVLQEQGDWFEDEMRFVRAFARPGMRVIDAGANFGVYALTLARAVGPAGRVWAVEPGAQALAHLAHSVAANDFKNVEIITCALSRADGRGFLGNADSPETRRLSGGSAGAAIEIRTLDSLGLTGIDFVKIDVEGEEANVLASATQFLARESPLLMIEYRAEKSVNEDIFAPLSRARLDCYRLVPGLNVLVPFYESEEADEYQLNLFACRESRARQLAAEGLLVTSNAQAGKAVHPGIDALSRLPYAQHCEKSWQDWARNAGGAHADYLAALGGFLAATDASRDPAARFQALDEAYVRLRELARADFTPAHAASFIRVAQACGHRAEAVTVCRCLAASLADAGAEIFAQPFLAPWPHYDTIAPGDDAAGWLRAAVVESFEQLFQFSSYFKPKLAPDFLGLAADARFLSAAYARRAAVFARRHSAAP